MRVQREQTDRMNKIPRPDLNEQADNCLLIARGDDISPHWLVYELHRDFLSAPRAFAVLRLWSDYDFEWLGDEFTEGVSRLDEADQHWRVSLPRLRFECWGEMELVDTCYGAASASEALVRVMTPD